MGDISIAKEYAKVTAASTIPTVVTVEVVVAVVGVVRMEHRYKHPSGSRVKGNCCWVRSGRESPVQG
ncbi:MAG: hypothetical protein RL330_763 [Actinomycetota bacterium]|jgi:hypothetical protein